MFSKAIVGSALMGAALAMPQWGGGPPGHGGPPGGHGPWPTHTEPWHSHSSSSSAANPTASAVLATFDNLPVQQASKAVPIGQYASLEYSGLTAAKLVTEAQVLAVARGIIPESQPNVAYYSAATIAQNGPPEISVADNHTKVTAFTLEGFWFGCATIAAHVTQSGPVACSIEISGYNLRDQAVATQTFTFEPTSGQSSNMMHAEVESSFSDLQKVEFKTLNNVQGNEDIAQNVATFLDSISYEVFFGLQGTSPGHHHSSSSTARGHHTSTSTARGHHTSTSTARGHHTSTSTTPHGHHPTSSSTARGHKTSTTTKHHKPTN